MAKVLLFDFVQICSNLPVIDRLCKWIVLLSSNSVYSYLLYLFNILFWQNGLRKMLNKLKLLISNHFFDSNKRKHPNEISRMTNQINQIFHYLSPTTWFNWLVSFVIEIPLGFNPLIHKRTWRRGIESPATEVYYMREKYGYFASKYSSDELKSRFFVFILASPAIRSSRSEYVRYRVGQVVRHKLYGYRAVITGWDEIASAPDEWLDEHHQGHPVRIQTSFFFLIKSSHYLGISYPTQLFCSAWYQRSTCT